MLSSLVVHELVSDPHAVPSESLAKDKYELKHVEENV